MVNHVVSNMMTCLRNAILVKKNKVSVISTRITKSISEILKREGYIDEVYETSTEKNGATFQELVLVLKYEGKKMNPVLTNVKCISKPGARIYANSKEIPQVLGGLGITIVSTPQGVLTDHEARKLNVGGEVLCMVW